MWLTPKVRGKSRRNLLAASSERISCSLSSCGRRFLTSPLHHALCTMHASRTGAAFASPRHQPRSLQRQLHPGVAQFDPLVLLQLLVKVLHIQSEILFPVEGEHLLQRGYRYPPGERLAATPVEQSVITKLLVAFPPTSHVSVADPDDLRRLPLRDLLRQRPQNHFLYFHCPLHRGLRVELHAYHGRLLSPPAKRTSHVLSRPDISSATDNVAGAHL